MTLRGVGRPEAGIVAEVWIEQEKKNPAGFGDDLQQVGEKWEYKMGVNPTDFDESLFNEYK